VPRRLVVVLGPVLAAALVALAAPAVAHAHGDPASVRFETEDLYPQPGDENAPPGIDRLAALVADAHDQGYRIKVALIASRADLGINPFFWREPQVYADYLERDVGPALRGPVLVVMPQGYGIAWPGKPVDAEQRTLAALPRPRPGHLAEDGVVAARSIARLAGVELSAGPRSDDGGSSRLAVGLGVGAAALVVAAFAAVVVLRRRRT
jgi:hypothetical protein